MSDGLCECGCGRTTTISTKSDATRGYVRGEPRRFVRGHGPRKRLYLDERSYTIEDRGHRTPCWIWAGKPNGDGYGIYSRGDGGSTLAHRRMFEKHRDLIPGSMQIDHLCRVRLCVNPDHFEIVTNAENQRRGARARVTPRIVGEIRASDENWLVLALRYDVHPSTVWRIRTGRSWGE